MRRTLESLRRLLAVLLLALWWGGFTFYAARVVSIGHQILNSKVRQGFITERVTNELNWLGLVTLVFVGWEFFASRRSICRRAAWVAWTTALLATLALFALHAQLAALLDFTTHRIADDEHFYGQHRVYLIVASVQWLASLGCLVSLLRCPRTDEFLR